MRGFLFGGQVPPVASASSGTGLTEARVVANSVVVRGFFAPLRRFAPGSLREQLSPHESLREV